MRFISILCLTLLCSTTAIAATPSTNITLDSLTQRMHRLPQAQQEMLVIATYAGAVKNMAKLDKSTPKKALQATHIYDVELMLMKIMAERAHAPELAAYFKKGHALINHGSHRATSLSEWNHQLAPLAASIDAKYADDSSMHGQIPEAFKNLRHDFTMYVIGFAKKEVWKPNHDKVSSTAIQHGLDEAMKAQRAIIARPQRDHIVSLLTASGDINATIRDRFAKVRDASDAKKTVQFSAAQIVLRRFSSLATRLGFHDASLCHIKESNQMGDRAEGKKTKPVGCRAFTYPYNSKVAMNKAMRNPRRKALTKLSDQWVAHLYAAAEIQARMHTKP